ncbi:E3 ubiquitin-protein ligase [Sarcoptes scabiei]|uniref:E3 ubiquitin-protein ligase n=1 Tax=Sarcoptes scabiei TaxID=52283 RepID=A0A834RGP7_SARSC|nr:E3 ubiquitin-protein ligase [Sarcoptes scabiei]
MFKRLCVLIIFLLIYLILSYLIVNTWNYWNHNGCNVKNYEKYTKNPKQNERNNHCDITNTNDDEDYEFDRIENSDHQDLVVNGDDNHPISKPIDQPQYFYLGLLILNLTITLEFLWIRSGSFDFEIKKFFQTLLDPNVFYVSIFYILQSSPIIKNRFAQSSLGSLKHLNEIIQKFSFDQPLPIERFFLTFGLTSAIIFYIRNRLHWFDDIESDETSIAFEQSSQILKCLSRFLNLLSIVLFRKTRRNPRRTFTSNELDSDFDIYYDILNDDDDDDDVNYEDRNEIDYTFDVDEDLDRMLIERLFAVPNLWLHTDLISNEYIQNLPIWNHHESIFAIDCNRNSIVSTESSGHSSLSSDDDLLESPDELERSDTQSKFLRQKKYFIKTTKKLSLKKFTSEKFIDNQCSCDRDDKMPPSTSKTEQFLQNIIVPSIITNRIKNSMSEKKVMRKRKLIATQKRKISSETNLSSKSISRPFNMIEMNDCTICLDQYQNDQLIMGLPCGHNYHRDCIGEWLTRGNHCCPICRWPSYRFEHSRQKFAKLPS